MLLFMFGVSFIAGFITLVFSFGLNIILIPVFSMMIPPYQAIALTGVVFIVYNLVRLSLTWPDIRWMVVVRFVPFAMVGVALGVFSLHHLLKEATSKELKVFTGLVLLLLLIVETFKLTDRIPFKSSAFYIYVGGFISGFAGSLVGSQGPFRVMALLKLQLNYKHFLATNSFLGLLIDVARVVGYSFSFLSLQAVMSPLVFTCMAGSILAFGVFFKFTSKFSMHKIRPMVLGLIFVLVICMIFI